MTDMPISWWIKLQDDKAVARSATTAITAGSPAELWRAIADGWPDAVVHIMSEGMSPLTDGVDAALAELRSNELAAVFARAQHADGPSIRLRKTEITRFIAVPPGAIVARATALKMAAAAITNGWDAFWSSDLAEALRQTGPVAGSEAVVASTPERLPPTPRMPFGRANPLHLPAPDAPLILVYGQIEASVSLYFDGLPPDLRARLRFLEPGDLFSDMGWLAAASLVIVVRSFEHMHLTGTHSLLVELGIPYVWFTDDDHLALASEQPAYGYYTPETLKAFTVGAAGIVTTSEPLAKVLASLHATTILWPLVYDAALSSPARNADEPFVAGAFGGAFRHRDFTANVAPALMERSIPTHATTDLARGTKGVTPVPFEKSFGSFVFRWQRLGLRALLHPSGASTNMPNKSRASLLAAAYLGAIPVVADEPAYAGTGEEQGVLKAAPDTWGDALDRLADPVEASRLFARLDDWCRTEFDPEKARASFAVLAALCLPGGPDAMAIRWQRACESRALQRALPTRSRLGKALARLSRSLKRRLSGRPR